MTNLATISDLYDHLDSLYDGASEDTLFASGYVRGFISLASTDFGGEEQLLTSAVVQSITDKLVKAKNELTPQDNAIVQNFWISLQSNIQ